MSISARSGTKTLRYIRSDLIYFNRIANATIYLLTYAGTRCKQAPELLTNEDEWEFKIYNVTVQFKISMPHERIRAAAGDEWDCIWFTYIFLDDNYKTGKQKLSNTKL